MFCSMVESRLVGINRGVVGSPRPGRDGAILSLAAMYLVYILQFELKRSGDRLRIDFRIARSTSWFITHALTPRPAVISPRDACPQFWQPQPNLAAAQFVNSPDIPSAKLTLSKVADVPSIT